MNDLVARLRHAANVASASADNDGYLCSVTIREAREAADALEQRWIPCSERLPPNGQVVLAARGGRTDFAFFGRGEWKMSSFSDFSPTRWMPLPPPPPESGG